MIARHWLLLALLPIASSCQQYARRPLDLNAHRAAIEARDPGAMEVVNYARELEASSASAGRYDPSDGLSIEEAEVVALFFNPQLRTARLRARVPLVGAAEAGRWEDPELDVDGERILQSVDEPWVLGARINFTLPLSGRLGVEREKAFAEADVERLRAWGEERKVIEELRAEWLEWSATREQIGLVEAVLKELDTLVESSNRLWEAGEISRVDARLFTIQRAMQRSRLRALKANARAAEVSLKARLGLMGDAKIALVPSLSAVKLSRASTQASEVLADHPRIILAQAEYEVAERALKLEIRKQYPDLTIGGGFGTDEGDERALFGLRLPLPILNRNRRVIAEATALRDVSRSAAEGELEVLLKEMLLARAAVEAADSHLAYLEKELAPLVDEQVRDVRQLGRLGEFNTLLLLEALEKSHATKTDLVEARLKLALALNRLKSIVEPTTRPAPAKETK
jgi:outer membrane protein TolC